MAATFRIVFVLALVSGFFPQVLEAAKIGDVTETRVIEQMFRFLSLKDPSVRATVIGTTLLGICCGLLGPFIVVRRLALVGDTLSHAVLPGVAMGFLWNMEKDPLAIFIGASLAGLIGACAVNLIKQTTHLKEDSALGMVLATFFAVGICMMTMIQRLPTGNKSGIDKYLFGQAAAMNQEDLILLSVVTTVVLLLVFLFYKEFLVTSFDAGFARSIGFPVNLIHYLLMLLLAFSVVVSLQAVGVVLVSAMLITPAAAAYLLTDRMHRMLILSVLFGVVAGVGGAFLSFLSNNLPTGPFMVLSATAVFLAAFFFSPRHGLIPRWWRQRSQTQRICRENILKAIYHILEAGEFEEEGVTFSELSIRRNEDLLEVRPQILDLEKADFVTVSKSENRIYFTPDGWQTACSIVRNHRLWELYLTNAVHYAADHVHDDAEKIEHVLEEETVRQLEKQLNYERRDPHGKPIPTFADIEKGLPTARQSRPATGYMSKS